MKSQPGITAWASHDDDPPAVSYPTLKLSVFWPYYVFGGFTLLFFAGLVGAIRLDTIGEHSAATLVGRLSLIPFGIAWIIGCILAADNQR